MKTCTVAALCISFLTLCLDVLLEFQICFASRQNITKAINISFNCDRNYCKLYTAIISCHVLCLLFNGGHACFGMIDCCWRHVKCPKTGRRRLHTYDQVTSQHIYGKLPQTARGHNYHCDVVRRASWRQQVGRADEWPIDYRRCHVKLSSKLLLQEEGHWIKMGDIVMAPIFLYLDIYKYLYYRSLQHQRQFIFRYCKYILGNPTMRCSCQHTGCV